MPSGPGAATAPLLTTDRQPVRLHSTDPADVSLACLALDKWEGRVKSRAAFLRPCGRLLMKQLGRWLAAPGLARSAVGVRAVEKG